MLRTVRHLFVLSALVALLTGCATPAGSSLGNFSYDAESQLLTVRFDKGGAYQYEGVPVEVFNQIRESDSQGAVFNELVKGQYKSTKVTD